MNLQKNIKSLAVLGVLVAIPGCEEFSKFAHGNLDYVTHEYTNFAIQGNLAEAQKWMNSQPESPEITRLKEQFNARFIERTDGLNWDAADPLAMALGKRMETYWQDALLNPDQVESLENSLRQDGGRIMVEAGYDLNEEFMKNPGAFVKKALEERGVYSIMGRTYPLMEFMAWTKQTTVHETIELTDGPVEVPIHFLDYFISYGWLNFATFGKSTSGGWANEEGLFIVTPEWDLEKEAYEVSFKTHEARHYKDYELYPNLSGENLEYRAKLTEIIFAEETVFSLLGKFTRNAAKVEGSSHPMANWRVIDDLSKAFFEGNWQKDPKAWEEIPKDEIRKEARALLEANSLELENARGAGSSNGMD